MNARAGLDGVRTVETAREARWTHSGAKGRIAISGSGPELQIDQAPESVFSAVVLLEHLMESRVRGKVAVILDGGIA